MLSLQAQGCHNIGDTPLVLKVPELSATLNPLPIRRELTELDALQLLLTDKFLTSTLLYHINSIAAEKKQNASKSEKRRFNAIDINIFWCFLGKYLLENLFAKGKVTEEKGRYEDLMINFIGKHRYNAIFSLFDLTEQQLENVFQELRKQIIEVIAIGSSLTMDETIVEYYGKDMVDAGIATNIPGKPHDYGLIIHMLAQLLLWSRLPIIVDFEPKMPSNKPTPKNAMLKMVSRVQQHLHHVGHVTADSAFVAAQSMQEFRDLHACLTIAVSSSTSCGYQDLYELGSTHLEIGKTRTYSIGSYIFQIKREEDHVIAVISNAWSSQQVIPQALTTPLLKYETAVYLYEHETMASIKQAFNLPKELSVGDPIAIIQAATGWNISLPPPTEEGAIIINQLTLSSMKVSQLRLLHSNTAQCKGSGRKNSDQLIADILKYHPLAQTQAQTSNYKKRKNIDVTTLRESLLGPNCETSTLIDYYNSSYKTIDNINWLFYEVTDCANHRTWQKLYLFSLIMVMVINARSIYVEHKYHRAYVKSRHKQTVIEESHIIPLPTFVLNLCTQINEKYK